MSERCEHGYRICARCDFLPHVWGGTVTEPAERWMPPVVLEPIDDDEEEWWDEEEP